MHSFTEENYLKSIFKLYSRDGKTVGTKAIAGLLNTASSSVTDMIRKLSEKGLVDYEKYHGVTLTPEGKKVALSTVRKHRLWEVFLVQRLGFKWDEVHEIAEQLEHIRSDELIDRLDAFLDHPEFDPHGDPIPDRNGEISIHFDTSLSDLLINESAMIIGVSDHSPEFLQFLEKNRLMPGTAITLIERYEFDQSATVRVQDEDKLLSNHICKSLYIRKI